MKKVTENGKVLLAECLGNFLSNADSLNQMMAHSFSGVVQIQCMPQEKKFAKQTDIQKENTSFDYYI